MTTTFIFGQYLNEEGCLSLSLDAQGQILSDCQQRPFSEIKKRQVDTKTIVVLPSQAFSLHRVELPWLNEKKARAALPFALEDQLAQNLEELHFAYDRQHYANGHYLVIVCDKNYLSSIIAQLGQHDLHFDAITLDWFALEKEEACLLTDGLVVSNDGFQGALSPELASLFLATLPPDHLRIYHCRDSLSLPLASAVTETNEEVVLWLAKRLQNRSFMNLCQGDFAQTGSQSNLMNWYKLALGMASVWLLTVLILSGIKLHHLNQQISDVDTKIAQIYHQFFPKSQQVISPKFRISQLLKNDSNTSDNSFWILLDKLATASQHAGIRIEQLRFQKNTLQVTLVCKDFNTLESLQNRLTSDNLSVKQTQASTREKKVVSTLELNL